MTGLCHLHRDALASFRCDACGKDLCYDCVDEDASAGAACRHCGKTAALLDDDDHRGTLAAPVPIGESETLYSPTSRGRDTPPSTGVRPARASSGRSADAAHWTPAANFAHHVAVPAATIAMVTALLFFLLDLRSVFLGDSRALKWVGFCFVTATVLTARYGKMVHGTLRSDRQGCYTLALATATLLVMIVSPWDPATSGWTGPFLNTLIILGVWRYATALTRGLSLEGERWQPRAQRIYGLERLALERWQQQRDEPAVKLSPPRTGREARVGNPCVAVARLAAGALVIFAIGEPWILAGSPEIGVRGLAAMVVFLLATGVALGAAAAVVTYRRIRDAGGRPTAGSVPGRLAASAGLTVLILSVALAMPGIEYRGSGELRPRPDSTGSSDGDRQRSGNAEDGHRSADGGSAGSDAAGDSPSGDGASQASAGGDPGRGPSAARTAEGPPDSGRSSASSAPSGAAAALLENMSGLGQLLRIPLFLAVGALILYGLWRLWPLLASLRWRQRLHGRWRQLLDRLGHFLRGLQAGPIARPPPDPFRDLDALARLAPRDAVLTAYGRVLEHFHRIGHPRAERQTPLEFQHQVQRSFRDGARPLEELTSVYLKAAYSRHDVVAEDRLAALAALAALRRSAET